MNNPDTDDGRNEEEDGSQETEGDVSLELRARRLASNAVPVPDRAAVHRTDVLERLSVSSWLLV